MQQNYKCHFAVLSVVTLVSLVLVFIGGVRTFNLSATNYLYGGGLGEKVFNAEEYSGGAGINYIRCTYVNYEKPWQNDTATCMSNADCNNNAWGPKYGKGYYCKRTPSGSLGDLECCTDDIECKSNYCNPNTHKCGPQQARVRVPETPPATTWPFRDPQYIQKQLSRGECKPQLANNEPCSHKYIGADEMADSMCQSGYCGGDEKCATPPERKKTYDLFPIPERPAFAKVGAGISLKTYGTSSASSTAGVSDNQLARESWAGTFFGEFMTQGRCLATDTYRAARPRSTGKVLAECGTIPKCEQSKCSNCAINKDKGMATSACALPNGSPVQTCDNGNSGRCISSQFGPDGGNVEGVQGKTCTGQNNCDDISSKCFYGSCISRMTIGSNNAVTDQRCEPGIMQQAECPLPANTVCVLPTNPGTPTAAPTKSKTGSCIDATLYETQQDTAKFQTGPTCDLPACDTNPLSPNVAASAASRIGTDCVSNRCTGIDYSTNLPDNLGPATNRRRLPTTVGKCEVGFVKVTYMKDWNKYTDYFYDPTSQPCDERTWCVRDATGNPTLKGHVVDSLGNTLYRPDENGKPDMKTPYPCDNFQVCTTPITGATSPNPTRTMMGKTCATGPKPRDATQLCDTAKSEVCASYFYKGGALQTDGGDQPSTPVGIDRIATNYQGASYQAAGLCSDSDSGCQMFVNDGKDGSCNSAQTQACTTAKTGQSCKRTCFLGQCYDENMRLVQIRQGTDTSPLNLIPQTCNSCNDCKVSTVKKRCPYQGFLDNIGTYDFAVDTAPSFAGRITDPTTAGTSDHGNAGWAESGVRRSCIQNFPICWKSKCYDANGAETGQICDDANGVENNGACQARACTVQCMSGTCINTQTDGPTADRPRKCTTMPPTTTLQAWQVSLMNDQRASNYYDSFGCDDANCVAADFSATAEGNYQCNWDGTGVSPPWGNCVRQLGGNSVCKVRYTGRYDCAMAPNPQLPSAAVYDGFNWDGRKCRYRSTWLNTANSVGSTMIDPLRNTGGTHTCARGTIGDNGADPVSMHTDTNPTAQWNGGTCATTGRKAPDSFYPNSCGMWCAIDPQTGQIALDKIGKPKCYKRGFDESNGVNSNTMKINDHYHSWTMDSNPTFNSDPARYQSMRNGELTNGMTRFYCDPADCQSTIVATSPANRGTMFPDYRPARCKYSGTFIKLRAGANLYQQRATTAPVATANTPWTCTDEEDGSGPDTVRDVNGNHYYQGRCKLAVEDCQWNFQRAECQLNGNYLCQGGSCTATTSPVKGDANCGSNNGASPAVGSDCTIEVTNCVLSVSGCTRSIDDATSCVKANGVKSKKYCLKHPTKLDNLDDLEDIANYGAKRLCKERQIYHIPGTVSGTFLIFQFIMFVYAIVKAPEGNMKTVYVWLAHVNLIMLLFFCMWMAEYTTTLFTKNVICWDPETLSEAYYLKKTYEGVGKYCYMYDKDLFSGEAAGQVYSMLGQRTPTDPLRHEFQVGVVSAYIGAAFGILAMLGFLVMALKDEPDSGQFADAPSMQLTTHQPAIGAKV